MVKLNWIPVTIGLPVEPDKNMLVILRPPVGSTKFDPDDRWMESATFDPGSGWSGGWDYYLGDDFIVTHWSARPEFPEDDE